MTLHRAQNGDSHGPRPRTPRVPMKLWSVTQWLIVVNIAVYVVDALVRHEIDPWLGFSA